MVDALSLSSVADLGEVGITGPAASAIAGFFGNLDEEENAELEALPQPLPLPAPLPEPEPQVPPSGPMAEFDEAAVLAWLGTVPGLTATQRSAAAQIMAEDEYEGAELASVKPKTLLRLLKGSDAEGAVPALLVARDAHLTAAASASAAAEERAAAEARPLSPPDELVCAISQQLMVDPVTTGAGRTYEREAIAIWLRTKKMDPLTGAKLPSKKLIPNVSLRQAIARWCEEHPGYTEL